MTHTRKFEMRAFPGRDDFVEPFRVRSLDPLLRPVSLHLSLHPGRRPHQYVLARSIMTGRFLISDNSLTEHLICVAMNQIYDLSRRV